MCPLCVTSFLPLPTFCACSSPENISFNVRSPSFASPRPQFTLPRPLRAAIMVTTATKNGAATATQTKKSQCPYFSPVLFPLTVRTTGRSSSSGGRKKLTPFNKFMQTETARLKEENPDLDSKERCAYMPSSCACSHRDSPRPDSSLSSTTGTSRRRRLEVSRASCDLARSRPHALQYDWRGLSCRLRNIIRLSAIRASFRSRPFPSMALPVYLRFPVTAMGRSSSADVYCIIILDTRIRIRNIEIHKFNFASPSRHEMNSTSKVHDRVYRQY